VAGPGRAARASSELDELTGDHEAPQRWGHDDTDLSPQEARQLCLAPDLPPDPEPDDPDPASAALDEEDGPTGRADPLTAPVYNLVGIKFASAGKIYLCDGGDALYRRGEQVVVETERGPRIGEVAVPGQRRAHRGQIRPILRRPNPHDLRSLERNEERAAQALAVARKYARALRLDIKVFRVEYSLSGNKLLIYFSSEAKVDFRELLRELGRELHTRVELRQTGVRDEAKMVGGIGSCGQTLCCTTWLPSFAPVSIKMAKDQGLVLNPTKVSGQCGRLKCCLVYEQDTYAELRRGLPKLGKRVVTQDGEGRVVEVDVLRQRIRVSLAVGEFKLYQPDEVKPLFPSQQPRHLEPEEGADEDGGEHQ
jgi:cell fate regulator YaaT (PSP1 superfamily)